MLAYSFEPPLAFEIGATVALIFSVALVFRASYLTEERFVRSEVWRALRDEERPAGEHGRRCGAGRAGSAAAALRQDRGRHRRHTLWLGFGAGGGVAGFGPRPYDFVTVGIPVLR